MAAFDVVDLRRGLATDVGRFAAATAQVEVMLRMAPAAPLAAAYDAFVVALDALVAAPPADVDATGLRGVWQLVAVLGFGPSLTDCVKDGTSLAADGPAAFSIAEGGVLCPRCARDVTETGAVTRLPAGDYRALLALHDASAALPALDVPHAAAHRRLVARFVRHHIGDRRPLAAMDFWERRAWATPVAS